MPRFLIRVNDQDRVIGQATRRACHTGAGLRHRAFLVMLFNPEGKLLLARRHPAKWLWPGWWDGTVAGHVEVGETYAGAARRRVFEEMGVRPRLRRTDKFTYEARWGKDGENEVCAVFAGQVDGVRPHPKEIDRLKWMAAPGGARLVPWLRIALERGSAQRRAPGR